LRLDSRVDSRATVIGLSLTGIFKHGPGWLAHRWYRDRLYKG